jgi:hypothetical protein
LRADGLERTAPWIDHGSAIELLLRHVEGPGFSAAGLQLIDEPLGAGRRVRLRKGLI